MRRILSVTILLLVILSALPALTDDELLVKVESDNLDIKKARSDYASSLLDVKDAKAGMGPTIDMTITGTYMYNPPIGPITVSTDNLLKQMSDQGVDVSAYSGLRNSYLKLYDGMEHTYYSFSLTITQPLVTWGKILNAIKLYEKVSEVRLLQVSSLTRQNKSKLLGYADAVYYLRNMQALLAEEQETASRLVEITKSMRDNGMMLDEDLLKVRIQAQQVDVGMREVEMQLENQVLGIQNLCNDPSLSLDMLSHVPDEDAMWALLSEGQEVLVAKATSGTLDSLQMLTRMQEVAEYSKNISSASVNWKPDIALQASLGYGGSRFPLIEKDWYRQDDSTMNFTIAVKSTIYDGGKKIRDVKRSKEKVEGSAIDYQNAIVQIRSQVITSCLSMELDSSKLAYQKLKIESDEKDMQRKKELFDSGYGNESDYLQARLSWQNDRMEQWKLLLDAAVQYRTLSYLSGV